MSWLTRRITRSSKRTRRAPISRRASLSLQRLDERALPSNTFVGMGAAQSYGLLEFNGGNLVMTNHAHVAGNVGVGDSGLARGQNSNVDGTVFVGTSASTQFGTGFIATGGVVTQDLSQVVSDANGASGFYQQLNPTRTFTDVKNSLTLVGNGGINVIRVRNFDYQRDTLTLRGGANDYFVFNIRGDFSFRNSTMRLQGGLTADHVLFNITTTGATVDIRNARSAIFGTILAPRGNVSYQDAANFQGAIMARNVSMFSRADLNNGTPLPPPPPPSAASISGTIFEDLDLSGVQESNEGGLAHFVVTLYDANGVQVGSSFETQEGNPTTGAFSFTGLQAGTYTLVVTPDLGYATLTNAVGNLGGDPDPQPDPTPGMGHDVIGNIVVGAGQQGTGYNFGAQNVGS